MNWAPSSQNPETWADKLTVAWPQDALAAEKLGPQHHVVILSHDPKFDLPALQIALHSQAAYVGLIGSRATQAKRKAALREAGFGEADLARREVRFDGGGREELSEREAALLKYLAAHAGRAISRDEILTRVWRLDPRGLATRTIDMHVARLREKLRDDPSDPAVILTVRGTGYMFAERRANG